MRKSCPFVLLPLSYKWERVDIMEGCPGGREHSGSCDEDEVHYLQCTLPIYIWIGLRISFDVGVMTISALL